MLLRHSRLIFLIAFILLTLTSANIQAQQGGLNRPTMRDRVRAITRADMDRQLLLSAILPENKEAEQARKAVLKQIREDFKDLQALNNKMMAEAWSKSTLDYGFISDMVSRIRGRATRLRMNLNLPQPSAPEQPGPTPAIADANQFRAALMVLDRTIMTFVSNPLFQHPNTIEVQQATNARRDLDAVIDLTIDLKQHAQRLGKNGHTP